MAIQESTIEELAARVRDGAPLSPLERRTVASLLLAYANILTKNTAAARISGDKRRRFSSDKERYAHHNAQRKLKREQNKGKP